MAALKSCVRASVVPPGLLVNNCVYPALKRWATISRPSGAVLLTLRLPCNYVKLVFAQTLTAAFLVRSTRSRSAAQRRQLARPRGGSTGELCSTYWRWSVRRRARGSAPESVVRLLRPIADEARDCGSAIPTGA